MVLLFCVVQQVSIQYFDRSFLYVSMGYAYVTRVNTMVVRQKVLLAWAYYYRLQRIFKPPN